MRIHLTQGDYMKKQIAITLILTLSFAMVLTGCVREDVKGGNNPDFSKFIGEWLEEGDAPNNLTWIFNENYRIKFIYYPGGNTGNSIIYGGDFGFDGNVLDVQSDEIVPICDSFTYEFSNDDTRLTLTSENGGDLTILNKVD